MPINNKQNASFSSHVRMSATLTRHYFVTWFRSAPLTIHLMWCLFVCLLAVALYAGFAFRSPKGLEMLVSWFDTPSLQTAIKKEEPAKQEEKEDESSTSDDISMSEMSSVVEQAQEISSLLNPQEVSLIEWTSKLKKGPVVLEPFTIKLRPYHLTEEQKYILRVQNITVIPWAATERVPESYDDMASSGVIWVESLQSKKWGVYSDLRTLMKNNPIGSRVISNLEIIKTVLWLDEWKAREYWIEKNPAPTPPDHLKPSQIGVQVIPSSVGVQIMFWMLMGAVGIYISMVAATVSALVWENSRSSGRYESMAGLSVPGWVIASGFFGFLWVAFLTCLVLSFILCVFALCISGIPVPWLEMIQNGLLFSAVSALSIALALAVTSCFSSRAWRVWSPIALVVVFLLAEICYLSFFTDSRLLAISLQGFGSILLCAMFLCISCLLIGWTGRRLDANGRLGLRIF